MRIETGGVGGAERCVDVAVLTGGIYMMYHGDTYKLPSKSAWALELDILYRGDTL